MIAGTCCALVAGEAHSADAQLNNKYKNLSKKGVHHWIVLDGSAFKKIVL